MINFRYHLVSLTAIFLALGLGIAMGASLVDRALVTGLEDQLNRVGSRADDVAATNDHLEQELEWWDLFARQASDRLLTDHLSDVPVVMITFAGVDGDVVARLESALRAAGASIPARVRFTSRLGSENEDAVAELAAIVAAGSMDPASARAEAVRRVAEAWSGRARPEVITELMGADFLEVTGEGGAPAPPIAELDARFLVISSADAELPNASVSVPLVVAMGEVGLPVVAADVTRGDSDPVPDSLPQGDDPQPFVSALRADEQVRGRVSTVDHGGGFRGRTAIVLALSELGQARVGQYGSGPGAERLLPD